MHAYRTRRRASGFNRIELLVVIGVVALLAAVLLPALAAAKAIARRINCVNNLKQVGIAFRVWEGDFPGVCQPEKYPMQFALTNSEAMRRIANGQAYVLWRSLSGYASTDWLSTNWAAPRDKWSTNSDYLYTPKYLHCPTDTKRTTTTNFFTLSDANISYFFSLDAEETCPQMIMTGDDNLLVDGARIKPGILKIWTNNIVAWTKKRHQRVGNIGMADGSVQQVSIEGLNAAIAAGATGVPTNAISPRWVIP
jgi:prepilin-type processing-associated H-X9-DG protein